MVPLSDRLAHALVGASPDAILLVDSGGAIRFANASVTSILGWSPEELIGEDVGLLVPTSKKPDHAGQVRAFYASPQARPMGKRRELRALHQDGHTVDVDIMLAPLHLDEPMVAVYLRDITALRDAEREVARGIRELAEAHARLERLAAARE